MAPAAMYAWHREFINRIPQEDRGLWVRKYENTADVIAAALSDDETLAQPARLSLRDTSEVLAAAVAFAVLGIAIGRARAHQRVKTGLLVVAVWWLGAWVLYNALHYWSLYLAILFGVARDAQPWLAAAIVAALAVTTYILASYRAPFRSAAHDC